MIALGDIQNFWTLPPQWGSTVAVSHSWKTGIQRGILGNEKRAAYNARYRLKEKFSVMATSYAESAWIKRNLYTHPHELWGVPIWPDITIVSPAAMTGATDIYCDTTYRHFKVDGFAILISQADFRVYEAVQVTAVDPAYISITVPLVADWLGGSVLYPLFAAKLSETEESKITAVVGRMTLTASELWLEGGS